MIPVASALLLILTLISCASPVILSGGDLGPEAQAHIRAQRDVRFSEIDGQPVDGRWFVVEPGTHSVQFISKKDHEDVSTGLAGLFHIVECKIDVDARAGETVFIASKLQRGETRFRQGYSAFGFHTELTIEHSLDDEVMPVDLSHCSSNYDCSKIDRDNVRSSGCSNF